MLNGYRKSASEWEVEIDAVTSEDLNRVGRNLMQTPVSISSFGTIINIIISTTTWHNKLLSSSYIIPLIAATIIRILYYCYKCECLSLCVYNIDTMCATNRWCDWSSSVEEGSEVGWPFE